MIRKQLKRQNFITTLLSGIVFILIFFSTQQIQAQGRGGMGRSMQGMGSRMGAAGGGGGSDSLSFEKRKFDDD